MALRLLASEEGEGEDSEARLLSNASAFEAPTGVQEGRVGSASLHLGLDSTN